MSTIRFLKTFIAVAQYGSFAAAADRVSLTNAAVGQQMRALEDEIRRPLFDQLHTLMLADVPMVMIYNGTSIGVVKAGIEGYRSWPISKPRLWGVSLAATSK